MHRLTLQSVQAYFRQEKAILLLPLIAIGLSLTLNPYCTTFWDSGIYVNMGNSIAQGQGAKHLGYTFKYPPVFPAVLAAIIMVWGYNFFLMRLFIITCALGSIWLAYLIVRDRSNRWMAAGILVATGVSYATFFECTRILSDIPYMFISLLAIRWIERYARTANRWRGKIGYITIGLIVLAYFTRIVGITLFAATVAYLALGGTALSRSRINLKKGIAVGLVMVTVTTLWLARGVLSDNEFPPELRQGLSYRKELFASTTEQPDAPTIDWVATFARLKDNTKYYEGLLSNIISGKRRRSATRAHLITLILLTGYIFCVFRHRSVLEYYTFFYLLTYILWPAHQRERFLVPIIPFLFYYLFRVIELGTTGIRWLIGRFTPWQDRRKLIDVFALLIFTAMFIQWNWAANARIIKNEKRDPYYSGRYGVLVSLTHWLTENTPDDTTVITSEPSFVQVIFEESAPNHRTYRKTFGFPWSEPDAVLQFIDRLGVDYIISVPSGRAKQHLHPVIGQYPTRFEMIHRQGSYKVYRVHP